MAKKNKWKKPKNKRKNKMAITWSCNITNADPDNFRADASFIRTDDVTGGVETYGYSKVIIETTAQRVALLDIVWAEHLRAIMKQTAIDAFITDLEQLAKINLEAREV